MKLQARAGYILVESPILVKFFGRLAAGRNTAKGAAMWPFLFVLGKDYTPDWLITHELIHFRQQLETLFIGLPILTFFERLYARFALKKDKFARYLYSASEQEAYLNMYNPDYLKNRPFGSVWHYVRHKRDFILTGPGILKFLDE